MHSLISEELVHAESVDTFVIRAEIDLLIAALASKASRAIAGEVVDQVRAVGP